MTEAQRFTALSNYLSVNGVAPTSITDLLAASQGGPVIIGDAATDPAPTKVISE